MYNIQYTIYTIAIATIIPNKLLVRYFASKCVNSNEAKGDRFYDCQNSIESIKKKITSIYEHLINSCNKAIPKLHNLIRIILT